MTSLLATTTTPATLASSARGLTLLLLAGLSEKEPIRRQRLEWYVDRSTAASNGLAELRRTLGPRPRRTNLYRAVVSLVHDGYVHQSGQGLTVTEAGLAAADDLRPYAPEFEPLT